MLNGLVLSDHLAVMVTPRIAARPDRSIVYFRQHRKIQTEHKLDTGVWSNLLSCDDITKAIHLLDNALTGIFNECFLLVKVKVSSWDPLVCRHWLNTCVTSGSIRNRNTRNYCDVNADLQARINELTRNNQVQLVRNENRKHGTGTKGWWNTVNKIIGRESKALNISSVINPVDIYCFFK